MNKSFENIENTHRYDDIIHLPHHVSTTHPHMPVHERAAQFSPFAALTGHQEALRETARLTDEKIELDENAKHMLDQKLQLLLMRNTKPPIVNITYFQQDPKKNGGSYQNTSGTVKNVNPHTRMVVMDNGLEIAADNIIDISQPFG